MVCSYTRSKIESSNSGTPAELEKISDDLGKMTEAANRNVGQCPDNIPFLNEPVREGYRRVIVLVAQTEKLMDRIFEFNNDIHTRVHIFIFHKSDRQVKPLKKLKEKYGVFPNFSDYGELEQGTFSRRLIR